MQSAAGDSSLRRIESGQPCVTTHKGVGLLTLLALGLLSNKASKPSPMWRASSSCFYAAVALARSLFRKGADFTAAMAFEMASANLVLELSIIMVALLGWQRARSGLRPGAWNAGLSGKTRRWFSRPQCPPSP